MIKTTRVRKSNFSVCKFVRIIICARAFLRNLNLDGTAFFFLFLLLLQELRDSRSFPSFLFYFTAFFTLHLRPKNDAAVRKIVPREFNQMHICTQMISVPAELFVDVYYGYTTKFHGQLQQPLLFLQGRSTKGKCINVK